MTEAEERAQQRVMAALMKQHRNNVLDAAIKTCEEFAKTNGSAVQCVRALVDLKEMMNQVGVASDEAKQ